MKGACALGLLLYEGCPVRCHSAGWGRRDVVLGVAAQWVLMAGAPV